MSFVDAKRLQWLNAQKENIVLFDMDGTLTEPRQEFDTSLLSSLRKLADKSQIGIVTGSDINYVQEQLRSLITTSELRYKLHLLPCNGTKYYKPPVHNDEKHKLVYEVDMKQRLGVEKFNTLMYLVLQQQLEFAETVAFHWSLAEVSELILTGHFVSYRGSMLNWSPIGRNADMGARGAFIEHDLSQYPTQRFQMLSKFKEILEGHGLLQFLDIKLGGDTSFDIYPKGWDKTHSLKHFDSYNVWFVGDRCDTGGNDKEIFDELAPRRRAYKTTGPENTRQIIEQIVEQLCSDESL